MPSRTIRPPRIPPLPPRISISQLPRIQRRTTAPARPPPPTPVPVPSTTPTTVTRTSNAVSSTNASFLDDLLSSQQRLYNLQNVRMHG